MAANPDVADRDSQAYLPDFCAARTIFFAVLLAELVAIAISLASEGFGETFLVELSKASLFLLWYVLLAAALLCRLRGWLERLGQRRAFVAGFVLLQSLSIVLAEASFMLTSRFGVSLVISHSHLNFLLSIFVISAIINSLTMRYLYVSSEWRRSILLEAQARISALQALIRPHFLFNSMNTIAALTRSDPARAEEAVEDLADLLRANLRASSDRASIASEIEIAQLYERIEKLRLGDRLRVDWQLTDLPASAAVPGLTLQPLLENAIYHGIEGLPDGGTVTVAGRMDGPYLELRISNPMSSEQIQRSDGHGMALANIQQRLELAYGSRASVTVDQQADNFSVCLRFPANGSA